MTDAPQEENDRQDYSLSFPKPGKIENDWRRWGLGQVLLGYALSLLASVVAINVLYATTSYGEWDELPMWGISLVGLPQQLILGLTVVVAADAYGKSLKHDFLFYMERKDVTLGLMSGVAAQLILVPLVTYPFVWLFDIDVDRISEPARNLSDRATSLFGVIIYSFCFIS